MLYTLGYSFSRNFTYTGSKKSGDTDEVLPDLDPPAGGFGGPKTGVSDFDPFCFPAFSRSCCAFHSLTVNPALAAKVLICQFANLE
jgi:hypothetical protein